MLEKGRVSLTPNLLLDRSEGSEELSPEVLDQCELQPHSALVQSLQLFLPLGLGLRLGLGLGLWWGWGCDCGWGWGRGRGRGCGWT